MDLRASVLEHFMCIAECAIKMHLPAPLHLPVPSIIEKRKRRRVGVCVVAEAFGSRQQGKLSSKHNHVLFSLPSFAVTKASERSLAGEIRRKT